MKKWLLHPLAITVLFYSAVFAQQRNTVLYNLDEKTLTARLALASEQVTTVQAMLKMLQAQMELDRQNFAGDTNALIAAGLRRARMAEDILNKNLTDSQKMQLLELKKLQQGEREIFELKEGLCLTTEQTAKARAILDVYKSKLYSDDSLPAGLADSQNYLANDRGIGGPPGSNRIGGSMNPGMRNNPGDPASLRAEERERAIAEILNGEQKKLFEQIKREWQKERDKMRQDAS